MQMNYSNKEQPVKNSIFSMSKVTVTSKSYVILNEISLELMPGSIGAVIGRFNTDIDALWSVFDLESEVKIQGTIQFCGENYTDRSFLNSTIQAIASESSLIRNFSVLENVFLTSNEYYWQKKRKSREKLEEIFRRFSIEIDPEISADALNSSECIIIELIRTYLLKPKLCVFRDILTQLSEKYQKIALKIIRALQKEENAGIIYLTTRYEEALQLAEHLIVVTDKCVNGEFEADEIIKDPKPLLYRLSGWKSFEFSERNNLGDMIDILLKMRENIESTSELKKALELLVESITKVMESDDCSILVTDDDLRVSMCVGNERLITDDVLMSVKNQISESKLETEDIILSDIMHNPKLQHIFYVPVFLNHELAGLIIAGYKEPQSNVLDKKQVLNNFAREMGITLETSRLVGKSILLQESHHRIKNNLQIIVNLLYLQKISLGKEKEEIGKIFDQTINQVKSIAIIHDLLSKDKLGKNIVDLETIIKEIVQFYKSEDITFELQLDNNTIPYNKGATISLLINELVANSVKHAFVGQHDKRIFISCKSKAGDLHIAVRDNGVGFPEGFEKGKQGLGYNIINTTVMKMGGKILRYNCNGACTEISFSRSSIYE